MAPLFPFDLDPDADERPAEWGVVAPSSHWADVPQGPPPPDDPRWWCAVHARPLTRQETTDPALDPDEPRCAWCRVPGLLDGSVPYAGRQAPARTRA